MIQFYVNGVEYTNRTRLEEKYSIAHTTLQLILAKDSLTKIKDSNKLYYLKSEIESIIEEKLKK